MLTNTHAALHKSTIAGGTINSTQSDSNFCKSFLFNMWEATMTTFKRLRPIHRLPLLRRSNPTGSSLGAGARRAHNLSK